MRMLPLIIASFLSCATFGQNIVLKIEDIKYKFYPSLNNGKVHLPSPFQLQNGEQYIVAVNENKKSAIIPVSLSNEGDFKPQILVDNKIFPSLSTTGLHNKSELETLDSITGRSIEEINQLAKPGGLSNAGFIGEDEDILIALIGDNSYVEKMNLTHPEMAKPLFHVLNMMQEDLALNRWNMAEHEWKHITHFFYNSCVVHVIAYDTKGGQQSIFDDGIEGAFHIKLWREFNNKELKFLKRNYGHLSEKDFNTMVEKLALINIGEIQAQYILRYGFYEGHTFWRADPIAIAFIFGLRSLEELHQTFEGDLYKVLTDPFSP